MLQVAAVQLRIVMDLATHHGLPAAELLEGLGVREEELRRGTRRRYAWDIYVEMLDRVAAFVGGPENMPNVGEGVPSAFPEGVALASTIVSPRALYRFANLVLEPVLFPMFRISVVDRPGERLLLTWELLPGYRECIALTYASLGTTRILPTVIGLPPARVEALEITGTRGVYLVELPPSRTLLARARRSVASRFRDQALRDMAADRAELMESFKRLQATASDLERRKAELSEEVAARSRLQASLTRVLETVSNAAFFVSNGTVTGANLAGTVALERQGAAFGAEVLAAAKEGTPSRFDVSETGAPGQRLLIRRGLEDEIERRLALALARWSLTPRQTDVLKGLVDGLSNGEIGQRLGCTPRTVEVHVTSILDRADAASRLQLVASFWGDL